MSHGTQWAKTWARQASSCDATEQDRGSQTVRAVRINGEFEPLMEALREASILLRNSIEVAQEIGPGIRSLFDTPAELCRVHCEEVTAGCAGEVRVVFYPSDRLLDLVKRSLTDSQGGLPCGH